VVLAALFLGRWLCLWVHSVLPGCHT
jgi:hypothetical protein